MRNRRGAARVITQENSNHALDTFALNHEVIDVAFLFQNARNFQLQSRRGNIHARVLSANRIANSCQHVGNGISHALLQVIANFRLPIFDCPSSNRQSAIGNRKSLLTSSISPRRESALAGPAHENRCGTSETFADSRAGGRISDSANSRATKTSACDPLWRLMIFLPCSYCL